MGPLALLLAMVATMACGGPTPELPGQPATVQGDKARQSAKKPNKAVTATGPSVVLIIVDTLRPDRLSLYGHDRTTSPGMEALARSAVVYEAAYSTAPWTKPAIGSILTSRYPSQLGLVGARPALPSAAVTLAETLSEAGYATGAVISHSDLGSTYRFEQGFDLFNESHVLGHKGMPAEGVTRDAVHWIKTQEGPYFLLAHYFDPHFAYMEREGSGLPKNPDYGGAVRSGLGYGKMRALVKQLDKPDVDELLRIYDTEIEATDRAIGALVHTALNRPGGEETVVVITADHGEEFLEHGRWGHTPRLYEELTRVPLLVRYPDGRAGRKTTPVSTLDVMPTILGAVGIEGVRDMEGVDLGDSVPADRALFSETASDTPRVAVVAGGDKLIHDRRKDTWELYNLAADPGEKTNTVEARPEVKERLAGMLAAWAKRMEITAVQRSGEDTVTLSVDDKKMLRELGDVDDK